MGINDLTLTSFEIADVKEEDDAKFIFISTSSASTSATSSSCS